MKIAITATEKRLDAPMDPRFGRAKFICIYDLDTKEETFIDNGQNLNIAHGAGTQAASIIIENKVDALITGSVGPKAYEVLSDLKLKMYAGKPEHSVMENIVMFRDNALNEITEAGETKHGGH